jgi:hypothetical protein
MPLKTVDAQEAELKLALLSIPASKGNGGAIDHKNLKKLRPLEKLSLQLVPSQGLNLFPPEIWIAILLRTDLKSLLVFRSVCRASRQLVESIRYYRNLVGHFPNLLRAVLLTRIASWLNLSQIHQALTTKSCEKCENFGEYIYLLKCKRYCGKHLSRHRQFQMTEAFWDRIHRFRNYSHCLPRLSTIPGKYRFEETGTSLVSIGAVTFLDMDDVWRIMKKNHLMRSRRFIMIYGPDKRFLPFACSIKAPWLNPMNNTLDWGCKCKFCPSNIPDSQIFSQDEFLRHVDSCADARTAWLSFSPGAKGRFHLAEEETMHMSG